MLGGWWELLVRSTQGNLVTGGRSVIAVGILYSWRGFLYVFDLFFSSSMYAGLLGNMYVRMYVCLE